MHFCRYPRTKTLKPFVIQTLLTKLSYKHLHTLKLKFFSNKKQFAPRITCFTFLSINFWSHFSLFSETRTKVIEFYIKVWVKQKPFWHLISCAENQYNETTGIFSEILNPCSSEYWLRLNSNSLSHTKPDNNDSVNHYSPETNDFSQEIMTPLKSVKK